MPAYNFMARFATLVESGEKRQTIRQTDKGAKPGDTAYLYTGQRTKQCRKLGEGRITAVLEILISRFDDGIFFARVMQINETQVWLVGKELDSLAIADGFSGGEEMVAWFEKQYGLPFFGYLHEWKLLDKPKETP
jgi:hypothetical protein